MEKETEMEANDRKKKKTGKKEKMTTTIIRKENTMKSELTRRKKVPKWPVKFS